MYCILIVCQKVNEVSNVDSHFLLNPHTALSGGCYYYHHLTEETEAQEVWVTYSRSLDGNWQSGDSQTPILKHGDSPRGKLPTN